MDRLFSVKLTKRIYLFILASAIVAMAWSGCVDTEVAPDAAPLEPDLVAHDISLSDLQSIRITPTDAVLKVMSGKTTTLTFKALGTFSNGKEADVTSQTTFQVASSRVGTFSDAVFYPALAWGGKTTVYASTSTGAKANTSLTVLFQSRSIGSGVPATVEADFDKGASNKGTPLTLAYPPDGVLLPTNLIELEFQWTPGAGQDYFEISLSNEGTDIRLYTKCAVKIGSGCGFTPSATEWKTIVGALKGYDAAKVKVRGADTSFSKVGESSSREMSVAEEDIQGGLYYWNATSGNIVRYDFGTPNQKAVPYYSKTDAKALFCVGCHALSLNGSRIAVGLDMPAPAPLQVLDVASRQLLVSGAANFMAFSPDGKMLITSNGQSMVLHETDTYKILNPNPLRAKGTMPDWSPDGNMVVYAEPAQVLPLPVGSPGISQGSLKLMGYDKTNQAWTGSITLVASAGENNYYPTFSPDGKWVVFNRSSSESYDATDAALYIVKPDGKGKVTELKLANEGANLCNSWPKFSPFLQKYKGGNLMWVTFSSRRDYGLRLSGKAQAQLWMAAIDPSKAELSSDPSYSAFWLPFQNIQTGNHIAQWTQKVVKKACDADGTCPTGLTCDKTTNLCEPKS